MPATNPIYDRRVKRHEVNRCVRPDCDICLGLEDRFPSPTGSPIFVMGLCCQHEWEDGKCTKCPASCVRDRVSGKIIQYDAGVKEV